MSRLFLKKTYILKIFLDKIQEIIYTCGEVMSMDFPTKIKMAEAVAKVKKLNLPGGWTPPAGIQPANENRKVQV